MRLAEPFWLLISFLPPLLWAWGRRRPRLAWPTLASLSGSPHAPSSWLPKGPRFAYILAFVCLAVALARPQVIGGRTRVAGKGVAIVVVLDRSGSMDTADFPTVDGAAPISRLEAARRALAEFIRGRPDDLIGLVVFANGPDLACPPTLDHRTLVSAANAIRPARAGEDGTNIGDALAWGLDAIRATSPRRKVLILLTDGQERPAVGDAPPLGPEAAAALLTS